MKNSTLVTLVYAKMNVELLESADCEQLADAPMFESVLDFVDAVIEEENVEMLGSEVEAISAGGDSRQQSNDSKGSDSGSGDAVDW
jgi:hypothetical protein